MVALVIGGIQTGGVVSFKKIAPDLSRANPFTGIKNIFRAERLVSSLRSLVAALVVAWLGLAVVKAEFASLANSVGNTEAASFVGLGLAQTLVWVAALVGLALGALDLVVTRHGWLKRHRMSKDEVRREHRQAEGDPELKAARTRAHREALSGAALNAVRDATVVIVNPTHLATALRYDEDSDSAPTVLSQGMGELAQNIVRAAHAYGVPVVRDVPVAQALQELETGDEIPEALYEAVAAILRDLSRDVGDT
jgi:flagellar biosynthesis protein FlhB